MNCYVRHNLKKYFPNITICFCNLNQIKSNRDAQLSIVPGQYDLLTVRVMLVLVPHSQLFNLKPQLEGQHQYESSPTCKVGWSDLFITFGDFRKATCFLRLGIILGVQFQKIVDLLNLLKILIL